MNWIEYRIAAARETRAATLDLSIPSSYLVRLDWGGPDLLKSIPGSILELPHLQHLNLDGHDIREVSSAISRMTNLGDLSITSDGDLVVSPEINQLPLRRLSISCRGDLSIDLRRLPHLEHLSLTAFHPMSLVGLDVLPCLATLALKLPLSSIPEELKRLSSLRELSLTQILELRQLELEGLGCAQWLDKLDLHGSWDLRKLRLPSLTRLSVFTRQSQDIEQVAHLLDRPLREFHVTVSNQDWRADLLAKLPHVEDLEISGATLPERLLSPLLHLKHLRLSFSAFVPSDIEAVLRRGDLETLHVYDVYSSVDHNTLFHCKNLRSLVLYDERPLNIQGKLTDLGMLERLSLSTCNSSALTDLNLLSHLRFLRLEGTQLAGSHEELWGLSHLEDLQLRGIGLEAVSPQVSSLRRLETLDLRSNEIREVPAEIAALPSLKWLDLSENPITNLPPEIVERGLAAIQGYFDSLSQGKVELLYEAKLLLVGEGGVGKSLLSRRLTAPDADLSQAAQELTSTRGIEIRDWPLVTTPGKPFRVHLWDFGGQEIYHATHQFFLTRRSLYLFVWDARREGREAGFDYWLNVITLLSGGSPILVILNKADERVRELDQRNLRERFPNVKGFHTVSALTGRGITDLIRDIQANAITLPHVGERWAASWSRVRRHLEAKGPEYINRDEYHRLCLAEGLHPPEADLLSSYLHDLGVILHFQDDPLLQNLVVLKPEWATNAVYSVLDTRVVQERFGHFDLRDLAAIWNGPTYPQAKHAELLQLMVRFELCFRLGDTPEYVAPELLRAEAPAYSWEGNGELRLDYRYAFMPAGITTRFIARNHALIEQNLYWSNGAVLAFEGARARVLAEPFHRRIRVAVVGKERHALLSIIRGELAHIHRTLNQPEVEEMVPCTCPVCAAGEPHFHKFHDLVAFRQNGIHTVPCIRGLRVVSVDELLEGFGAESPRHAAPADASPRPQSVEVVVRVQSSNSGGKDPVTRSEPPSPTGPWNSGLFYLLLLVVVFACLAVVGYFLTLWALPVIVVGTLLAVSIVGALQLRQDRHLTEKSFLSLMAMTLRKLPRLGAAAADRGAVTGDGSETAAEVAAADRKGEGPIDDRRDA